MPQFDWPWVLALLPLPWLLRYLLPRAAAATGASLRVPELHDFEVLSSGGGLAHPTSARLLLASLSWLCLLVSAARPVWIGEAIELPVNGRDLMIALDLSESMHEGDFVLDNQPVNRLVASKAVAQEFISRRIGDRIGLILFADRVYLQAPLTFDHQTVQQFLDEAAIGLAGRLTAIGDALGIAVKRLREQKTEHKVLILMTDGTNTAGTIAPLRAAELAREAGLTVYTIGIGADQTMQRGFFGSMRVSPSSDLDEDTLRAIAQKTGGRYFRVRDVDEFEKVYRVIDQLEPVDHDGSHYRPTTALFYWPLGVALCLYLVLIGMAQFAPRGELA
jgi:Ca-activated chloride channel homolog